MKLHYNIVFTVLVLFLFQDSVSGCFKHYDKCKKHDDCCTRFCDRTMVGASFEEGICGYEIFHDLMSVYRQSKRPPHVVFLVDIQPLIHLSHVDTHSLEYIQTLILRILLYYVENVDNRITWGYRFLILLVLLLLCPIDVFILYQPLP
ncbi:unnamed protein product [Cunninghamella echinulata]